MEEPKVSNIYFYHKDGNMIFKNIFNEGKITNKIEDDKHVGYLIFNKKDDKILSKPILNRSQYEKYLSESEPNIIAQYCIMFPKENPMLYLKEFKRKYDPTENKMEELKYKLLDQIVNDSKFLRGIQEDDMIAFIENITVNREKKIDISLLFKFYEGIFDLDKNEVYKLINYLNYLDNDKLLDIIIYSVYENIDLTNYYESISKFSLINRIKKIISSTGLLKESDDIQEKIDYIKSLYLEKKSNNWKKRILTEFVCEFYGNIGCTNYGERISRSLIRVAATRIFADPEQSIMELPVNSVDSYKLLEGGKSVGKFGMGFFSIFYWIIQPLNGKYNRFITIETVYNEGSYKATMKWTNEGLLLEKTELINKIFNGKETTGTRITLDFTTQPIDDITLNKIIKYIIKLKFIKDVMIGLNIKYSSLFEENKLELNNLPTIDLGILLSINLNNSESKNLVNVTITNTKIIIEDNASGITFDTLENSLLVPSSSTKSRNLEIEDFQEPLILESKIPKMYIVVNGISIIEIPSGDNDYIIIMPSNTKLPVSRDDIIFTNYEIKIFKKACSFVINKLIKKENIHDFMIILEKYTLINKSPLLVQMIKNIRSKIESSSYILVPKTKFYKQLIEQIPIKTKIAYYDQVNMFETEKRLNNILLQYAKNDIFKLKKVIFMPMDEKIESGGLSEYLFISTKYPFIPSDLALKENTTLLIPYNEEYEVEFFNDDVKNINSHYLYNLDYINTFSEDIRDMFNNISHNVYKIAKIAKMTFIKKFLNFEGYFDNSEYSNSFNHYNSVCNNLIDYYTVIVCTAFKKYNINQEEIIPYIINLNSNLINYQIKLIYGERLCKKLVTHIFKYNNYIYDFKYNDPITIKMLKDSLLMFNEMFNLKYHDTFLNIPELSEYILINVNPNAFKNKKLYNELILAVKETINYIETFNIVKIFFIIDLESVNVIQCDGLGIYILDEIRKRISSDNLLILYKELFIKANYLLKSTIFNPIVKTALTYINFMSQKKINKDIVVIGQYKFSAKQLIEYLFNNEITDKVFETLSHEYFTYKSPEKKLQVIEIAVNEGTNKDFIQSVLTELIQNSTDAIRSANGNNNIDIFIGDNKISMKDYIGFENLIDIMIPFLSSKDPNDPNVTGEMGSGFFNAYRQPFTKEVIITSVFNGKKRIVKGEPIVINNNVTDIIYTIDIKDTKEHNSTEIQLVFHNNIKLLSRVIADATIFTNNYLSFIPGINCKCNNIPIQKQFNTTYNYQGITFYTIDDITTESYVMTNGIPLMPLKNFINSLEIKKNNLFSAEEIFNVFCQNSIILDISKYIYTPTQSRSKIQFKNINHNILLTTILNGFYCSILNLYCMDNFKSMRDSIISHSSSISDPSQLTLSGIIKIHNFIPAYTYDFSTKNGNFEKIRDYINYLINQGKYPDSPRESENIQEKVARIWFGDKKYKENEIKDKKKTIIALPTPFTVLQLFIDIYWSKIKILYDTKIIITNKFKNSLPPKILIGEIDSGTKAFYRPSDHTIVMNSFYYNQENLRNELLQFKDITNLTAKFTMNSTISKYFSSCLPACTLIHEIGHAIDKESHSSSSHGITNIKVRNSDYLDFDNMCILIYQEAIGLGLIEEFLKTVV